MKLIRAVSCWGNQASPLEGPLPADFPARDVDKSLIVEIPTGCAAGIYMPSLRATPAEYFEDFRRKLAVALPLNPLPITTLAGADFWDFSTACRFFGELLEVAKAAGSEVCVETHRSRPTFHPLQTARLLDELTHLMLTLDVSHWCVVSR